MRNTLLKLSTFFIGAITALLPITSPAFAADYGENNSNGSTVRMQSYINADISASAIGSTNAALNAATRENISRISGSGTLIEIGNTTANSTTVVVRQTKSDGTTIDLTLEITSGTIINTHFGNRSNLSDWIAGDQIAFTALKYENSGQIIATVVIDRSFQPVHRGINGWITAIRPDKSQIDVTWEGKIYTLNVANAALVAGLKNPATINDLQINDRVRARVTDDGDTNRLTWNANIVVVLRRGDDLFMRMTRFVVQAKIVNLPANLTIPTTIEVELLASPFFQEHDVNNRIGKPGDHVFVDIVANTHLARKYLGKALLTEFSEGDTVRIIGRVDDASAHVVAKFIKNENVQKVGISYRFGTVTAINGGDSTLTVKLKDSNQADTAWMVKISPTTKLYIDGTLGVFGDVNVGDIIRVRGTANTSTHTIAASTLSVVESTELDSMIRNKSYFEGLKD